MNNDTITERIDRMKLLQKYNHNNNFINYDGLNTENFIVPVVDEFIDTEGDTVRSKNSSRCSNDTRLLLGKSFMKFDDYLNSLGSNYKLTYINSGTTGHTFKLDVNNISLAVKVVPYAKNKNTEYGDIYNANRPENAELHMIKVLAYFVKNEITPHIVLPSNTFYSDINFFVRYYNDNRKVISLESKNKYKDFMKRYKDDYYDDKVSILISEWANNGDLLAFLRTHIDNKLLTLLHWKVFFFQILFTLAIIQSKYPNFRHNDLKANNILVQKTESVKKSFSYKLNGCEFKIPNIKYQLRLWDFDFACIPGIVDNSKVGLEWTKKINVKNEANRYYDVHYFFNMLLKFRLISHNNVPQEIKEFFNRIVPKKYQSDTATSKIREDINTKLKEKFKNNQELHDLCENNDFGGCFVNDFKIENKIIKKAIYNEIIPKYYPNCPISLGIIHERGRILIKDEFMTPMKILLEDELFNEFKLSKKNINNQKRESKKEIKRLSNKKNISNEIKSHPSRKIIPNNHSYPNYKEPLNNFEEKIKNNSINLLSLLKETSHVNTYEK